jgi:hypothetical protein
MPTNVEWIQEPNILQITYQGNITLEDVVAGWEQVATTYQRYQEHPFCLVLVFLPDRQIPVGLLKLATHPVMNILRFVDAASVVNADHVVVGMYIEKLSSLDFAPTFRRFDNFLTASNYLKQVVRVQQSGLGLV